MSGTTPLVGITSYHEVAATGVWNVPAAYLPWSYAAPVVAAGGAVAVLPPQPASPDAVSAALDGISGLYIAGGYDVAPSRYGAAAHAETDAPRADRDAWELALVLAAMERNMPLLGVCRGAQLLNVARGGTLHQHVPDVVGHDGYTGGGGVFARMPVETVPGTRLAAMHPGRRDVPVYHHQAIDRVGAGLIVNAWGDDGIVEGVEDPSLPFCVAVQWHPEQDADEPGIFAAFVAAARAQR